MNASRDQREVAKRMNSIIRRLDQIEEKETEVMEELRNQLEASVTSAVLELSKYLKSDDVKARFTTWTLDEVPKAEGSWEETNSNITKALENRLQEIIEHWEENRQVFSNARRSLVQHCQQRYNIVVGKLKNLQHTVTNDDLEVPETIPPKRGLTTTEKVVIGLTSPIWVPVSLVTLLLGGPVVGMKEVKHKLKDKRRIEGYKVDKCAFMTEGSTDYLDEATNQSVLRVFVEKQVNEAKLCLEQIEARIPELIEADKMLCKALGDVSCSQEEIKKVYQPIMDEASDIRGHLAVFALNEIRATDIPNEELKISSRLGCGVFATLYKGKMTKQGDEQTVALKMCNEVLHSKNASLIMAEVELLR